LKAGLTQQLACVSKFGQRTQPQPMTEEEPTSAQLPDSRQLRQVELSPGVTQRTYLSHSLSLSLSLGFKRPTWT